PESEKARKYMQRALPARPALRRSMYNKSALAKTHLAWPFSGLAPKPVRRAATSRAKEKLQAVYARQEASETGANWKAVNTVSRNSYQDMLLLIKEHKKPGSRVSARSARPIALLVP
ncbi:MAG: hypothetical protein ACTTKK_09405, partial [Ottowia sp.]